MMTYPTKNRKPTMKKKTLSDQKSKWMPAVFQVLIGLALISLASCAEPAPEPEPEHFPGAQWEHAENAEQLGFNAEKLALARDYSSTINTAAVMIVRDGRIVDAWGETDRKFMTHSIRKSFMSAMYGKYIRDGVIDLDMTMEEAGIDDDPPLTPLERTATIRDCLKSRSGIYHDALYESQGMKDLKPIGLVVRPGTFWYYNNWDFNASGTIFEKMTGKGIFEALKLEIADPIGMEDFEVEDGWYVHGEESIHPAYPFHISTRDLARFGLLMLRGGRWGEVQVVPADWVVESTRYHSDATLYGFDGYGYMWWVASDFNTFPHLPNVDIPEGSYSARGAGGHYLLIIPDHDLVIVHRVDTYIPGNSVGAAEFGNLTRLILEAMEE
jgi:CubicO group peptidase (beta-lactamase class C family)